MEPRARHGAAQGFSPRRRSRRPSLPMGSGDAPAERAELDQNAPDLSPLLQARQRPRLSHRPRRHAAAPVPIAAPKVEPLSSRPVPRSRFSLPERSSPRSSSPDALLPVSSPEQQDSFPELSSSMSSSSSVASSASSLLTVLADEDETCESSLSEPDVFFEQKRSGDMVTVPTGVKVREFVGEGSANVVVGIELPEETPMATRKFFEGMISSAELFPGRAQRE